MVPDADGSRVASHDSCTGQNKERCCGHHTRAQTHLGLDKGQAQRLTAVAWVGAADLCCQPDTGRGAETGVRRQENATSCLNDFRLALQPTAIR